MQLQDLIRHIEAQGENSPHVLGRYLDEYLVQGGTLYTQQADGKTLLGVAANLNQTDLVKELVSQGGYRQEALSCVEVSIDLILLPLTSALHNNNVEMVEHLLRIVPIEFYQNKVHVGYTEHAKKIGNRESIIALVAQARLQRNSFATLPPPGIPMDQIAFSDLENALDTKSSNFSALLSDYLKGGGYIHAQGMNGFTLLTGLVSHGKSHQALLKILLSHLEATGIEVADGNKQTALGMACKLQEEEIVHLLREKAESEKKLPAVEMMMPMQTVSCLTSLGKVSFQQVENAIKANDPSFFPLLRNYLNREGEVRIHEHNRLGFNILTLVVSYGKDRLSMLEAVLSLLEADDVGVADGRGETPLSLAINMGEEEMVNRLMEKAETKSRPKAIIHRGPGFKSDSKGITVTDIEKAIQSRDSNFLKLFNDYLKRGGDMNAKGLHGHTFLTRATMMALNSCEHTSKPSVEILKVVLSCLDIAQVRMPDASGRTALDCLEIIECSNPRVKEEIVALFSDKMPEKTTKLLNLNS